MEWPLPALFPTWVDEIRRPSRAASAPLFVSARVAVLFVFRRRVALVSRPAAVRHSAVLPCSARLLSLSLSLSVSSVFLVVRRLINEQQEEYKRRPLLPLPSHLFGSMTQKEDGKPAEPSPSAHHDPVRFYSPDWERSLCNFPRFDLALFSPAFV